MSANFEEELENIKASLKYLGTIEETLISDNCLESRSESELDSRQDSEYGSKSNFKELNYKIQTDFEVDKLYSSEKTIKQYNEIIKEKSNLINRLYNCIEELKGEIQELTSSLDYHIQINNEMEKELEFYRYSKEPKDNYVQHI